MVLGERNERVGQASLSRKGGVQAAVSEINERMARSTSLDYSILPRLQSEAYKSSNPISNGASFAKKFQGLFSNFSGTSRPQEEGPRADKENCEAPTPQGIFSSTSGGWDKEKKQLLEEIQALRNRCEAEIPELLQERMSAEKKLEDAETQLKTEKRTAEVALKSLGESKEEIDRLNLMIGEQMLAIQGLTSNMKKLQLKNGSLSSEVRNLEAEKQKITDEKRELSEKVARLSAAMEQPKISVQNPEDLSGGNSALRRETREGSQECANCATVKREATKQRDHLVVELDNKPAVIGHGNHQSGSSRTSSSSDDSEGTNPGATDTTISLQQLQKELKGVRFTMRSLRADRETLRTKYLAKTKELATMNAEFSRLKDDFSDSMKNLSVMTEKFKNSKDLFDRSETDNARLRSDIEKVRATAAEELAKVQNALSKSIAELSQVRERTAVVETLHKKEVEEKNILRTQAMDLHREKDRMTESLEEMKRSLQGPPDGGAHIIELTELRTKNKDLAAKCVAMEGQLEWIESLRKELEESQKQTRELSRALDEQQASRQKDTEDFKRDISFRQTRILELERLLEYTSTSMQLAETPPSTRPSEGEQNEPPQIEYPEHSDPSSAETSETDQAMLEKLRKTREISKQKGSFLVMAISGFFGTKDASEPQQ